MPSPSPPCLFTDGRAGNLRQARALATALVTTPAREVELHARVPWRWAAPRRLPGSTKAFGHAFEALLRDPPELAIGCGRQAALATRLLRCSGSRVVQILDPGIASRHWDVLVVPAHDRLRAANRIEVQGSLHPVDAAWLAAGRASFPRLGELPGPRTLVLLGGPVAAAPLDAGWWRGVADHLSRWQATLGGSLMLAISPRTPAWLTTAAREAWPGWTGARWTGAGDGPNPYPGMLAWADRIVVSPDSVNLVSEACATSAPVWVAGIERCRGRQRRFLDAMLGRDRIRGLGRDAARWPVKPLDEMLGVAAALRQRLGLDRLDQPGRSGGERKSSP